MSPDAPNPERPPPPVAAPAQPARPDPPPQPRGGGRARFATTHWSVVLAASGRERHPPEGKAVPDGRVPSADEAEANAARAAEDARAALAELCQSYWYPLYAYVRARGHGREEAQDLTQAFFARLLEKDVLKAADPERGRFRSFLLASLKNFLSNERDRAAAAKRGGGKAPLPLEVCFDEAERRYSREPADTLTPDRLFERGWAVMLLDGVLKALREQYADDGRSALFDHLKPYLAGDADAPPYATTGQAMGISESAVQVAVYRMRKRYREQLRRHIEQTVESPGQVEEEIRDLFRAVRG